MSTSRITRLQRKISVWVWMWVGGAVLVTSALTAASEAEPFIASAGDETTHASTMRIASRAYASPEPGKPTIWLIGAVHIGAEDYYAALQAHMDPMDLVLYEGVGRPEMFEIWGRDGAQAVERTRRQLEGLQDLLRLTAYDPERGWPVSLDALAADWTDRASSVMANQLTHARVDAWGNAVQYDVDGDHVLLTSFGSDGAEGGTGTAADLTQRVIPRKRKADQADASGGSGGSGGSGASGGGGGGAISGLQQTMAKSFGLVYQLHSVDYDRDHFVPSDMSGPQMQKAMARVGVYMDFSGEGEGDGGAALLREMGGPGAGLSMGVMKAMSGFIAASPSLQELARLMMIELLSREDLMEIAAGAMGNADLLKVLIDERNQVVIDDLKAVVDGAVQPMPASIGVFYGAAHLPDMAERLADQLGYKPTGEVVWFDAMRADPASTGMPPENVALTKGFLQRMVDQAVLQQKMMAPGKKDNER